MRTFTHNHKDDTLLERDGNTIRFTFWSDTFTYEDPDTMEFSVSQDELFRMLADYFEAGQHADLFDQLTLPGQDALWNALLWMDQRHVQL